MEQNQNKISHLLVPVAMILGLMLLIGLFFRPVLFLLLLTVVIILPFLGFYQLFQSLKGKSETDPIIKSAESSIREQITLCEREIVKHRKENREIRINMDELEDSLDKSDELDSRNRKESKRILAGFYRELDLRKAKLKFYETCQSKLETLLYNYRYSKKLEIKQAKLKELQKDHYEDLAKMETLKTDMAYNMRFLKTIESLSLKMLESDTLDDAKQLQIELNEITKELKKL